MHSRIFIVICCLDGRSEQTLIEDNSMSVMPCTTPCRLSAVNSLSHKFNIEAFDTSCTKVNISVLVINFKTGPALMTSQCRYL